MMKIYSNVNEIKTLCHIQKRLLNLSLSEYFPLIIIFFFFFFFYTICMP